jgi:hypothetical protein
MDCIIEFIHSNYMVTIGGFITAITGAFIGTFYGAKIAQNIAQDSKIREEKLTEIRDVNAALTLTFYVGNALLTFKSQHLQRFKTNYEDHRLIWLSILEARRNHTAEPQFPADMEPVDLSGISPINIPVESLQKLILEKISLQARPLAALLEIINTNMELNFIIEQRNKLIEHFKATQLHVPRQQDFEALLYGTPNEHGFEDGSYRDLVEGIFIYLDQGIFFSKLLCDDLMSHGQKLCKEYSEKYNDKQEIDEVDFLTEKSKIFMPDPASFEGWLSGFVKKEMSA